MQSKVMNIVGPQSYSSTTCCVKSLKKKNKTPFVVNWPKCCQKTQSGPLGIKSGETNWKLVNWQGIVFLKPTEW